MSKKMGISALLILLNISVVGQVLASDPQGWGKVYMLGSIIETACAIDISSRDQTIDMGLMPVSVIAREGQSITRPFTIQLVNCTLAKNSKSQPEWQHFQVTFDGKPDAGLFSVHGEAQGIALQIADSQGNIALPGIALPKGEVQSGDMPLKYSLRLVSNNKLLRAGEYFSTVKFKMDYY
ncbi:fimbrial protein [Rahnella variigena]|jgi:type 1 fimbria pilin|uniref:fimbrial protein n=1 Tax=Rahnella variigena TaxID=574964 RepID=UPI003CE91978